MVKNYILKHKTAKAIAKDNGLVDASTISHYASSTDHIFFDVSLLDEIKFKDENTKQIVIENLIKNHSVAWYDQPLPTLCLPDDWTCITGQINTVFHKVYSTKTWKRVMVIVEVVKAELSVDKRADFWDRYYKNHVADYSADNHHSQPAMDVEL